MSDLLISIIVLILLCLIILFEFYKKLIINNYFNALCLRNSKLNNNAMNLELIKVRVGLSVFYYICIKVLNEDKDSRELVYLTQRMSEMVKVYRPLAKLDIYKKNYFLGEVSFENKISIEKFKHILCSYFNAEIPAVDIGAKFVLYKSTTNIILRIPIGIRDVIWKRRVNFFRVLLDAS
jgi:hypothetical protein